MVRLIWTIYMIRLYMLGTAEKIDGVYVDYILVNEGDVDALIEAGWRMSVEELN